MREEDKWYRTADWSSDGQAEFRRRLARARRVNRPQYVYLKACSLHESGQVQAARDLWREVLEFPDSEGFELDRLRALTELAESLATAAPRELEQAEETLRELLIRNPEGKWSDMHYIGLAEILVDRGRSDDLTEAESLLTEWRDKTTTPFPAAYFRWNLAKLRLAQARRDGAAAREAAIAALELAGMGPVFPRHKTVGVVTADAKTIKRLQKIARR